MIFAAGIDVGAASTKAVILSEERKVLGKGIVKTGADPGGAARRAYDQALGEAGLAEREIDYVASTGFGRYIVPFRNVQMTDLTSHGQGVLYLFPNTRSVLDIGGQSTRAMKIEPNGRVKLFRMNEKCAAGSGTFLLRCAHYLEITLEDLGPLSLKSRNPVSISSVCAVLAESEIINHVTANVPLEDIVKGSILSICSRAITLVKRIGVEQEVTLTGGTVLNPGVVACVEELLETKVNVDPERGPYAGALGAGILGLMRLQKTRSRVEETAGAVNP